jgi:hypothetical protein
MADDLRAAERESPAIAETLLLISRGDPQANRAEGFEAPIVLEEDVFGLGRAVGAPGTPSALPVDGEGRRRAAPVVGADAVLALLRGSAADQPGAAIPGTRLTPRDSK